MNEPRVQDQFTALTRPIPPTQSSPAEVLEAVSQGIDLFDCSYTAAATSGGYALSFPITTGSRSDKEAAAPEALLVGDSDFKINLWSTAFR